MPIDTAGWVRHMLDTTRDYVVVLIDADAVIVGWQGSAENVFGYTAAEAIGRPFSMLFTPEDLDAGLDRLHRAGTACQRQPKVDPGAAATGSSFSFRQQSPMAPCRLPFSGTGRPAASRLP